MKKKIVLVLIMAMALSAAGCSKGSKDSTESATEAVANNKEVQENLQKVKTDCGEIELAQYKGVEANLKVKEPTEEDLEGYINDSIAEYAEEKESKEPVKNKDYVHVDIKASIDGKEVKDYFEEGTCLTIGEETVDKKLDEALIGKKKGDSFEVEVAYDANAEEKQFANKTVVYSGKIKKITYDKYPELTDDFVKKIENGDFKSVDDFKEKKKQEMVSGWEEEYQNEMKGSLIVSIAEKCKVVSYEDSFYDSTKEEVENNYLSFGMQFGMSTIEEVMEGFGMTDEDLETEIKSRISAKLAEKAIAKLEGITITDEEYKSLVESYAKEQGVSVKEFEEANGKDYLKEQFLELKILDFLADNAKINEVDARKVEAEENESGDDSSTVNPEQLSTENN